MKKNTLLIVAAVAVMFFAMAATAHADTVSGFETWSQTAGGNSGTGNPHQSYATTTIKCAVCHAVHKAPTTGEVLLNTQVANACVTCHITSDTGNKVIYTDGDHQNNYSGADSHYAHNASATLTTMGPYNVTCVMCHTVHGAGRITGNTNSVGAKILKPTGFQTTNGAPDPNADNLSWDARITGFCTRCHPYYMDAYSGEVVTDTIGGGTYRSHVMKVADAVYTGTGGNYPGRVAWGPSSTCRSCHDAGLTDQGTGQIVSSFPHRTPGAERFLKRADHINDTTNATNSVDANYDGVCLKCHATGVNGSATPTAGVGVTY
jgi:predicted CXXCH cytochrome family protein